MSVTHVIHQQKGIPHLVELLHVIPVGVATGDGHVKLLKMGLLGP